MSMDVLDVVHVRRDLWEEKERQIRVLSQELAECKDSGGGLDWDLVIAGMVKFANAVIRHLDGEAETTANRQLRRHAESIVLWKANLDRMG